MELYSLNNNNNDDSNKFPEKPKNVYIPLTTVSSTLDRTITNNSENLKEKTISMPLTINTLSQQKGDRVVRYWYKKDPKRKTMTQRFGLTKSLNSSDVLNKSNKKNIILKQKDKTKYPKLVSKMPESVITTSKIKRSSLVNFTPTNIDINNIPNISATTTTNTILNSTSSYRGERNQNLALNNTDSNSNSSGKNSNENDSIHQYYGKEIIIRDLNSNDKIYYSFNLEDGNKGKIDFQTKDNQGKVLSSTIISNKNGQTFIEKNEVNSTILPSSTNSSPSTSPSLSSTSSSDKEPLRKSSKRFNHRRQNSVRLQISY
jgi:hypothetical protein